MIRFDGAVVLVTGASTGIGAAVARGFGAAGATVVCHYNASADEAEQVRAGIVADGGDAVTMQADLSAAGGAAGLVARVLDSHGHVDVLVNNAGGLVRRTAVADASDDVYDRIMDLNLRATFEACRAVVPSMRQRRAGVIVNVSSISARNGGGGGSVLYAAAKAAVATFTRGLGKELAGDGIRVNALSPGVIDTPFHAAYTDEERFAQMLETIPMGRAGTADECVGPTLFLASDEMSGYITGQVLEVNGGQYTP